jgi:hypothetical protein
VLEKSLKLTAIKHKCGRFDSTREAFRYNLRMPGWETMGWKKSGFTIGRKHKVQYSMLRHNPWSISDCERYLLAVAMTLQTLLRHLGSTLSGIYPEGNSVSFWKRIPFLTSIRHRDFKEFMITMLTWADHSPWQRARSYYVGNMGIAGRM